MVERKVVVDFDSFGGKHCQTTALKSILDHNGLHLSEEMLLGLGGGLGFIYWYMKKMPAPFVGGRTGGKNEEFVRNIIKRIGGKGELFRSGSVKRGYGELMKILRSGQPAYVYGDMAYLPYMAIPEDAHFGYHTFVVYGIDEGTNTVYVGDRGRHGVTVTIDELNRARNSKFHPFPPKNQLLKIELPERMADIRPGIVEGIKDCVYDMMNPPIKNFGLAGIKKWASMVPKWPKMFEGFNLFMCLFNVFIYIEIGGTGGGAFRPMYARFLAEAVELLERPGLLEAAGKFEESAKVWSDIAAIALPDSWPALGRIRELSYKKNEIFEEYGPGALEKMHKINREGEPLMEQAVRELGERDTTELFGGMRERILELYDREEEAFQVLERVMEG